MQIRGWIREGIIDMCIMIKRVNAKGGHDA